MASSTGLLLMLLLGFVGLLVMFLFILRAVAAHQALLREGLARQNAALADMEGRLLEILYLLRNGPAGAQPARPAEGAAPPADLAGLLEGAAKLPPLNGSFSGNGRSPGRDGTLDIKMDS